MTPEDFADAPPTGGLLLEQAAFVPSRCANGEGVDADGIVHWTGGPARYVYVMEAGSGNPTIPPNLDLPEGTLWRIDVHHTGTPMPSGTVRYASPPDGIFQKFPADGPARALVEGREYYLYVTRDVGQPITRCTFVY